MKRIISDRFVLEREVGSGGMGTIFQAWDREEKAAVALKILRGKDPTDIERFSREAAVLASLRHPGIVRYIDHGTTADEERYLAMEWLAGEDLAARLARKPLFLAESMKLFRRVAHALAFLHARGAVHRDIKPANLLLVGNDVDQVKLVDFGIARAGAEAARLTIVGTFIGTPGYVAPEHIPTARSYDPRADVFSLGCVFFECLAGRPAFEGEHAMAVLAKVLLEEPPRLRDVRPEVPEVLCDLVTRMMAKAPEERPAGCADVAAELDSMGDFAGLSPAKESLRPAARRTEPPLDERTAIAALSSLARRPVAFGERDTIAAPLSRAPASLTLDEQRIVSVVLAGDPTAVNAPPDTWPPAADLTDALEQHGGRLHMLPHGALVVTLWGDGTVVDRAERAARCALALRARFASLPICVATGRGRTSMRVVEGAVLDRGVAALACAPGGVVTVDDVTADMLRDRFELERAGDAHVLRGERPFKEGAPILLGKPTRCIGRSRELATLEGVLSGCISEAVASAVVVTGAAGAGKSRLCNELIERMRQRGEPVEILIGRASSLGASSPFGMIAAAIDRAAGLGGEPEEARRRKLVAWLRRFATGGPAEAERASWIDPIAPFLGEIAHVPFPDDDNDALRAARASPPLMSDAVRSAWEEWLAAACRTRPVLIVLDDLHWGDAATVQLMDSTLRRLRELPLMILAFGRPDVHTRFPALWSEREVQTLRLPPLSRKASEQLVRDVLGPSAPAEVVARVVARADGNPFHLEELVRAVSAGRGETLPESVLGTIEARLDAEGGEGKLVLRAASVLGDRFTAKHVEALLSGALHPSRVAAWIEALVARELFVEVNTSPPGAGRLYAFQHSLVREAAYAMLTEADRTLGHRLAGEWLERSGGSNPMVLAEHFRRGSAPSRAVSWYHRAATQALEASDLSTALEVAGRGVECGAEGEQLGALRLVEAEAHVWQGDLARSEQRAAEAAHLLAPGSAPWFRAISQSIISAGKLGLYDKIEGLASEASGLAATSAAWSAQIICLAECASYLTFGGRYAAADALIERLRRDVPDPDTLSPRAAALLHHLFAIRASYAGDDCACLAAFQAALAAFESAGDKRNACAVRSNLGCVLTELGDFKRAEEALRAALAWAGAMGLRDLEAAVLQNLGRVLGYLGHLEEARRLEQQSAEVFHKLGDLRMEGTSLRYLAEIALLAGDLGVAEQKAREAVSALHVAPPLQATATAVLARVLLGQGRLSEALLAAREAFSILEALGVLENGESLVRLVYAEALEAGGEQAELARALALARARLLERAERITDDVWRERFLTAVPDNARMQSMWARVTSHNKPRALPQRDRAGQEQFDLGVANRPATFISRN